MAEEKKVVSEMLVEFLASIFNLFKKWIEWGINVNKTVDMFHQIKKEDLFGLLNKTHDIREIKSVKEKVKVFTSNFFKKTTVLNVKKSPDSVEITESFVRDFLKPIFEREEKRKKENGDQKPSIDNDIWNWFTGKVVAGIAENFTSVIYRFLSVINHRQILKEGEDKGIKKIYNYFEALTIIKEAILAGEVDERNKAIIAYFGIEINKKIILYRFRAFRFDDGQLGLNVVEVNLDVELVPGDRVCFSN